MQLQVCQAVHAQSEAVPDLCRANESMCHGFCTLSDDDWRQALEVSCQDQIGRNDCTKICGLVYQSCRKVWEACWRETGHAIGCDCRLQFAEEPLKSPSHLMS